MISSTIEDLKRERDAIDGAIRHFRLQRFRSEMLGSLARSPREVCEELARDCDLYVLIVGRRYGWIIPDLNVSVTEREYTAARDQDPSKILVYVSEIKGVREPRADAFLRRVTDFTSGYFRAKPFRTPEELAEQFKNDLAAWLSERILQRKLSITTVFGLPDLDDVRASLRNFVVGSVVLAGGLQFVRMSGQYNFLPSPIEVLQDTFRNASQIYGSILTALFWSVCAVIIAALLWAIMFVALIPFKPSARAHLLKFAPVLLVAALMGILIFGRLLLGIGATFPLMTTALVLALYLGNSVAREIKWLVEEGRTWNNERDLSQALTMRLFLSPLLPNSIPLAFCVFAGTDLALGGAQSTLMRTFIDGQLTYRIALSSAVMVNAGLAIFTVHSAIRAIQATVGWSFLHDQITAPSQADSSPMNRKTTTTLRG